MTLPVTNTQVPLVDSRGLITTGWQAFFQQFTQAPSGAMTLIVTASPFSYIVKEPGLINVSGGIVTSISLVRGSVIIDVTGQKLIPVSIKDTIIVVYTGLPNILFLPNF